MISEDQQAYNWNIEDMPWKSDMNPQNGSSVVLFNGNRPSTSGINLNRPPRMKRKTHDVDFL
jgi:hypothetical protein